MCLCSYFSHLPKKFFLILSPALSCLWEVMSIAPAILMTGITVCQPITETLWSHLVSSRTGRGTAVVTNKVLVLVVHLS